MENWALDVHEACFWHLRAPHCAGKREIKGRVVEKDKDLVLSEHCAQRESCWAGGNSMWGPEGPRGDD